MATVHETHHTNGRHGLGGMSWQVLAAIVVVGGAFAGVAYNMGQQSTRLDQVEKDVVRIDSRYHETQKENNFRITILERKAAK